MYGIQLTAGGANVNLKSEISAGCKIPLVGKTLKTESKSGTLSSSAGCSVVCEEGRQPEVSFGMMGLYTIHWKGSSTLLVDTQTSNII